MKRATKSSSKKAVAKSPPMKEIAAKTYRQEHESKDDNKVTTGFQDILLWHKTLAVITGGLSLRITKRSLSVVDLNNWIIALEKVSQEMKNFLEKKEKK